MSLPQWRVKLPTTTNCSDVGHPKHPPFRSVVPTITTLHLGLGLLHPRRAIPKETVPPPEGELCAKRELELREQIREHKRARRNDPRTFRATANQFREKQ